jgi:2-polyprenyl-6-methoxyphenol hydroxylase-like FAD-dependent oxidoreductase
MQHHYAVIIVGGRIAGASLAIRLGQQQIPVLLIDRAAFPSWPSVPSSPMVHPGTMRLLDELGFSEADYTHPDGRVTHFILDVLGKYQAIMPTELLELDRNYLYGIDRYKFDTALWRRAASLPSVTAYENAAMIDVIKNDAGRVTGIVAKADDRTAATYTADLVVGADGRFSGVAHKVGSQPFEELNQYPSASYHAEWENVAPHSEQYPHSVVVYQIGNGYSLLCIPVGDGKYIIANYLRTGDTQVSGKMEAHYLETLQSTPGLRERLAHARRISRVVGVRRIDNGYRQAWGDGWALVGDAFHYESPIDGQGIYNALVCSKLLAEAIQQWRGGKPWQAAGADYQQRFYASNHTMLKQTVKRVQQELYTTPPPFVINTLMRWMLTDPAYQQRFLRYLSRAIDPRSFSFGPSLGPLARGFMRDLRRARSSAAKRA